MIQHILAEALEVLNEMHPSIKNAFDTNSHPLKDHPIFKKHGKAMAHDQYGELTRDKNRIDMQGLFSILHKIQAIEHKHQDELIKLAEDIVRKIWNVDEDIKFNGELTNDVSLSDKDQDDGDDEISPELKDQIDKRVTMNMLTHGSALHVMSSAHHIATEELNKISPELLALYNKFATSAMLSSWFMDMDQMLKLMGAAKGGANNVKIDDDVEIQAQAMVFPILVQEFSKGVMELLTMHQLSDMDEKDLKKLYKHADKYEHEFFHFFVGPAVWRKFLKVVPKDRLAKVIAKLSKDVKPNDVTAFINDVIENPESAKEMIAGLLGDEDESR